MFRRTARSSRPCSPASSSPWIPSSLRRVPPPASKFRLPASPFPCYAKSRTLFDRALRRRLFPSAPEPAPERRLEELCSAERGLPGMLMALDFETWHPDDILAKVDRTRRLASLETRSPWLDAKIVDFAFSQVPNALRAGRKEAKILPRGLARRLLPAGFDVDRKRGFSIPVNEWFRGPWGKLAREVLLDLQARGYRNGERLFALLFFELCRREHRLIR